MHSRARVSAGERERAFVLARKRMCMRVSALERTQERERGGKERERERERERAVACARGELAFHLCLIVSR
jgi:hypothetical protein